MCMKWLLQDFMTKLFEVQIHKTYKALPLNDVTLGPTSNYCFIGTMIVVCLVGLAENRNVTLKC